MKIINIIVYSIIHYLMTENDRLEIMWPSYNNIHKNIKIIDKLGYFTIKIDGTNFSIHIKNISDTWKIQSINSRKFSIWPKDNCKLNEIKTIYGSVDELPIHMFNISISIANKLNISEIIVFGELFRAKKDNIDAKFLSWHPFGYWEPSLEKNTKIFIPNFLNDICPIPANIINNNTLIEHLINADNYQIFQPKCSFFGIISDGIKELALEMSNAPSNFEGFFIILDENNGVKWKTHWHEEQPKLNIYKSNIDTEIYEIFKSIFTKKKEFKDNEIILESQITLALNNIEKKDYNSLFYADSKLKINELISLIIEEIQSHYKDCNCEMPWSIDEIKIKSKKIIKNKELSLS